MSNISITAPLVDGSLMPYVDISESCRSACQLITGDDLRPPAQRVVITVTTDAGRVVELTIPNSETGVVRVTLDGASI